VYLHPGSLGDGVGARAVEGANRSHIDGGGVTLMAVSQGSLSRDSRDGSAVGLVEAASAVRAVRGVGLTKHRVFAQRRLLGKRVRAVRCLDGLGSRLVEDGVGGDHVELAAVGICTTNGV